MVGSYRRVLRVVDKAFKAVIDGLAAFLLLALLIVVFGQVVDRYVMGGAMLWSEEVTRLLFVWMVLIAAAYTSHLRIDVLLLALKGPIRFWAEFSIGLFSIGLLVLLAWMGYLMIEVLGTEVYPVLGVSVEYLYWSVVVGSVLWILGIILALLRLRFLQETTA